MTTSKNPHAFFRPYIRAVYPAAADGHAASSAPEAGRDAVFVSLAGLRAWAEETGISLRAAMIDLLAENIWPERFRRNFGLFSAAEMARLLQSRALVLGCGGLGGHVTELLARSGVGRIRLVDNDVFDESNLNRQRFCSERALGRPKAQTTREALADIAAHDGLCFIEGLRVLPGGANALFAGKRAQPDAQVVAPPLGGCHGAGQPGRYLRCDFGADAALQMVQQRDKKGAGADEGACDMKVPIEDELNKGIRRMQQVISTANETTTENFLQSAALIAEDDDFTAAVAEKNHDATRKLAVVLMKKAGSDFMTVTDEKGTVVARGHSQKFGDSVLKQETVVKALQGAPAAAVVAGTEVPFTIRASYPILHDGKLVGSVSIGTSLVAPAYLDWLKKLSGVNVTIFKGDTRVMTTILKDGKRAVGTKLQSPEIVKAVLDRGETVFSHNNILGVDYNSSYWPVRDANGKVVGMPRLKSPRAARSMPRHTKKQHKLISTQRRWCRKYTASIKKGDTMVE